MDRDSKSASVVDIIISVHQCYLDRELQSAKQGLSMGEDVLFRYRLPDKASSKLVAGGLE
jgi:hypothetical protein